MNERRTCPAAVLDGVVRRAPLFCAFVCSNKERGKPRFGGWQDWPRSCSDSKVGVERGIWACGRCPVPGGRCPMRLPVLRWRAAHRVSCRIGARQRTDEDEDGAVHAGNRVGGSPPSCRTSFDPSPAAYSPFRPHIRWWGSDDDDDDDDDLTKLSGQEYNASNGFCVANTAHTRAKDAAASSSPPPPRLS
jgi:hypothetical protein